MKLTVLVENTCSRPALAGEHGLSLYLETRSHRILFDAGTTDLFEQNARALGVDLEQVDLAVLSHGHRDHGGGMVRFMELNRKARLYLRPQALEPHFSQKTQGLAQVGVEADRLPRERLVLTGDLERIDEELTLFARVEGRRFWSDSNSNLMKEEAGALVPDDFAHEQDLIVTEGEKKILIAGCSHNGVANILDRYHQLTGGWPDVVVGGFHLLSPGTGRSVPADQVRQLGEYLAGLPCRYLTGHCTGPEAYDVLKEVLGDRLEALTTGGVWEL